MSTDNRRLTRQAGNAYNLHFNRRRPVPNGTRHTQMVQPNKGPKLTTNIRRQRRHIVVVEHTGRRRRRRLYRRLGYNENDKWCLFVAFSCAPASQPASQPESVSIWSGADGQPSWPQTQGLLKTCRSRSRTRTEYRSLALAIDIQELRAARWLRNISDSASAQLERFAAAAAAVDAHKRSAGIICHSLARFARLMQPNPNPNPDLDASAYHYYCRSDWRRRHEKRAVSVRLFSSSTLLVAGLFWQQRPS